VVCNRVTRLVPLYYRPSAGLLDIRQKNKSKRSRGHCEKFFPGCRKVAYNAGS
jgi:hypothetical protein